MGKSKLGGKLLSSHGTPNGNANVHQKLLALIPITSQIIVASHFHLEEWLLPVGG
jgi:hypothetical protein